MGAGGTGGAAYYRQRTGPRPGSAHARGAESGGAGGAQLAHQTRGAADADELARRLAALARARATDTSDTVAISAAEAAVADAAANRGRPPTSKRNQSGGATDGGSSQGSGSGTWAVRSDRNRGAARFGSAARARPQSAGRGAVRAQDQGPSHGAEYGDIPPVAGGAGMTAAMQAQQHLRRAASAGRVRAAAGHPSAGGLRGTERGSAGADQGSSSRTSLGYGASGAAHTGSGT